MIIFVFFTFPFTLASILDGMTGTEAIIFQSWTHKYEETPYTLDTMEKD